MLLTMKDLLRIRCVTHRDGLNSNMRIIMAHTFHNRSQAVFCIFGVSPNFITYVDNHIPLFGCIIFASGFFYKKIKTEQNRNCDEMVYECIYLWCRSNKSALIVVLRQVICHLIINWICIEKYVLCVFCHVIVLYDV